jgi:hypothetical protein
MFKLISKFFLVFLVVGLVSCATTYQKKSFTGGFSETQLGENVWKVNFKGNGYTSQERADDFTLLRCAELTLSTGYSYFKLVDSKSYTEKSSYTTPVTSNTQINAQRYGDTIYGNATTQSYGGQTHFISKPGASNVVMMFKDKTDKDGMLFDAGFICNTVGSNYEVQCNSQ